MSRDWRRGGSTRAWNKRRAWWAARLPVSCFYCGAPVEPGSDWHLSHTVPRVWGGRDRESAPAHALCNLRAGSRLVEPGSMDPRSHFLFREPSLVAEPVDDRGPDGDVEAEPPGEPFRIY